MKNPDVVIVGAGVAGLAVAWHLAQRGTRVSVFEMEAMCGAHASGRNAAIFRSVDAHPETPLLAARSLKLMHTVGMPDAVRAVGLVQEATSATAGTGESLSRFELEKRLPMLAHRQGEFRWFPRDGVLDIHRLMGALLVALRTRGVAVHQGHRVQLLRHGEQLAVLDRALGEIQPGLVVLAAGAWSGAIGDSAGLGLPLTPFGRQLTHFLSVPGVLAAQPAVWLHGAGEVYFRPESGGLLASGCEETEESPGEKVCDEAATYELAARLRAVAPVFDQATVGRSWRCQRTFAPDHAFVAGPDPRVHNLVWATALGGRGMTCGLALAEMVADFITNQRPLPAAWAPGRLLVERSVT